MEARNDEELGLQHACGSDNAFAVGFYDGSSVVDA